MSKKARLIKGLIVDNGQKYEITDNFDQKHLATSTTVKLEIGGEKRSPRKTGRCA